jgi:hypothetical protein
MEEMQTDEKLLELPICCGYLHLYETGTLVYKLPAIPLKLIESFRSITVEAGDLNPR